MAGPLLFNSTMPGRAHQSLLWLFRRDPKLAVELAAYATGREPPREVVVRDRQGVLQCPAPRGDERTVELDLLLSVHARAFNGSAGELIRHIWIVEVQLGRDLTRVRAWTDYYLAVLHQLEVGRSEVDMLVVSPHPGVRDWLRRKVLTRMVGEPLLIEPRHIPWVDRLEYALTRPEAAVLSAVFHGHSLHATPVVQTACLALQNLEPPIRDHYRYLIQVAANETMELPFPIQEPFPDDIPSEWEQRGLTWAQHGERIAAQAREQAREQGRLALLAARREDLLTMLELVGLSPSGLELARIQHCEDPDVLATWVRSVKGVPSVAELLAPS